MLVISAGIQVYLTVNSMLSQQDILSWNQEIRPLCAASLGPAGVTALHCYPYSLGKVELGEEDMQKADWEMWGW